MGIWDRLKNLLAKGWEAARGHAPAGGADEYFRRPGSLTPVQSSNVKAIGYFASVARGQKGKLGIEFRNGSLYVYDAPLQTYTDMMAASSKGQFVHRELVRKRVPYKRIR